MFTMTKQVCTVCRYLPTHSLAPIAAPSHPPKLPSTPLTPPIPLQVTAYAIESAQERGQLFVRPGDQVYEGQVVGMYSKAGDLKVNVCKQKALTNMRAATKEVKTALDEARVMGLDEVSYTRGRGNGREPLVRQHLPLQVPPKTQHHPQQHQLHCLGRGLVSLIISSSFCTIALLPLTLALLPEQSVP